MEPLHASRSDCELMSVQPLRVLVLHNRYRQFGGEDAVMDAEVKMLRANGVEVQVVLFDNEVEPGHEMLGMVQLGRRSAWSADSAHRISQQCRQFRPHVAHVHNFWMRLTAAAHGACQAEGVATVQTLHNFRPLCLNAQFLRQGVVCQDCLGKVPWRGVLRRCYRNSIFSSAVVANMIMVNRRRRTWQELVDAFVAMSEHTRQQFIAGGFPADRILLKPNFIVDPGMNEAPPSSSRSIAYIGRLSPEKGVHILLAAWAKLRSDKPAALLIVGDGPARPALQQQARQLGFAEPDVVFTGWKTREEVQALLPSVRAWVLPSLWFEGGGCPVSLVEALAAGRPLIVSGLGGIREMVEDGGNGLHCIPGEPQSLAEAIGRILSDDALADALGLSARRTFETRHLPAQNFQRLMEIYAFARRHRDESAHCSRDIRLNLPADSNAEGEPQG
jgi:glycosyltransferase involved in cell wall biosynthesis